MKDVAPERRTAKFRCIIAVVSPAGKPNLFEGECSGFITLAPRGELGFGYDPIFLFLELGKTMAELPVDVKNRISHRGLAAEKARIYLQQLAGK
jgi:XTP/dITP diphosphohydrolase